MLSILLPFLVHGRLDPAFDFDLRSRQGLTIRANGAQIVLGDGIQLYEHGWTKGYYSSGNGDQTVTKPDADTAEMSFAGADGRAKGRESAHRDGNHLTVRYHFEWTGDQQAEIELTAGLMWAPALQAGTLSADTHPTRALSGNTYTPDQDLETRRYAPDAKVFEFTAPLGAVSVQSSLPMTLFDARGYHQGYAEGRSVWWYGALDIPIQPGKPVDVEVDWTIRPTSLTPGSVQAQTVAAAEIPDAQVPDLRIAPLIPKPKIAILDYGKPAPITNVFAFPAGRPRYWDLFKEMLSRRYDVPPPAKGAAALKVDGGISRLDFHRGGYTIDIRPTSVSVLGEEEEGLRNGMYRLAQLAFVREGRLYWPTGHLEDQPQALWRGVHLFGGPEARDFQRRLWDRVLLPLGMNWVVVQCERTAWQSTPLDPSTHPMSREDLAGLFDDYRKMGVNPVPLIQSLGHMEWFFGGKRRLELAVNPDQPYTLDPRKPATKAAIEGLWDEAIELLKPSAAHFGCDEIDMRGMSPHNAELTTDLWREQMATLGGIARKHRVGMMIWGDEGLAPGEAVDATNGDTKEEASNRRAAIPQGATVCDWHYAADPDPAKYYPTLQLWKREGLNPIASTWYQPDNIRGFNLAANLEHVGTLQTTWAGYESSERGMIDNSGQFTALVTAADYAWSARQDPVNRVGYDPTEVFRQMYFGSPSPVLPQSGVVYGTPSQGGHVTIGKTSFTTSNGFVFRSVLLPNLASAPTQGILNVSGHRMVSHVALALDAANAGQEGREVATVRIELENQEPITRRLVYGHHVRAATDPRLTPYAERGTPEQGTNACAVTIDLPRSAAVRRIAVESTDLTVGLRWLGATGY